MGCNRPDSTQTCQRSGDSTIYLVYWGSFLAIALFCLCYVGALSYKLYQTVLQIERKSDQFNFLQHTRFSGLEKKAHESREKSSFLKRQGLLYTGALLIVWVFVLQFYVVWLTKGPDYVSYLMLHIFYPAQGFLNFVTYILPKEIGSKKKARLNLLRSKVIKNRMNHEEKVKIGLEVNSTLNQFSDTTVTRSSQVKSMNQNEEEKIEIEPPSTQEVFESNNCNENEATSHDFSTLHESSHNQLDFTPHMDQIDRKERNLLVENLNHVEKNDQNADPLKECTSSPRISMVEEEGSTEKKSLVDAVP